MSSLSAWNASRTRLPPSPELRPNSQAATQDFVGIDLMDTTISEQPRRLRSMASYESFRPKALATSHHQLGALAGSHGIAVLDVSKLQSPLMILSCALSQRNIPTCLAFQPTAYSNAWHLALTRGSSVLVWDVSGHSLSPLWGRLGSEGRMDEVIIDMAWKPLDGPPVIACTSETVASLWDLRNPPNRSKPICRFEGGAGVRHAQISCSSGNECGILDMHGILRLYDIRMPSSIPLLSMPIFRHTGIGLSFLDADDWITWGIDTPTSNAEVKVWSATSYNASDAKNDSWGNILSTGGHAAITQLKLKGTCAVANLACARVCPGDPRHFVTLGLEDQSWRAHLWTMQSQSIVQSSAFSAIAGIDNDEVRAAELASSHQDVMLCVLTEKGLLATYAIPEASSPFLGPKGDKTPVTSGKERVETKEPRIFPSDRESAIPDVARLWSRTDMMPEPPNAPTGMAHPVTSRVGVELDKQESMPGEFPAQHEETTTQPSFAAILPGTTTVSASDFISSNAAAQSSANDGDERSIARAESISLMKTIDTNRIPCPRLCGASFGPGVGGFAVIHNGHVRKVWKWWDTNHPTRFSTVPGLIGEAAPSNMRLTPTMEALSASNSMEMEPRRVLPGRECPRTLKDLTDMIAAARAAQWGEQAASEASSIAGGTQAHADNFFEDDSDASSDSAEDFLSGSEGKEAKDIYTQYFGASQDITQLLGVTPLVCEDATNVDPMEARTQDGTPSDMLSPLVRVFFDYDALALNRQSVALARGWKIGDIDVSDQFTKEKGSCYYGNAIRDTGQLIHESSLQNALIHLQSPRREASQTHQGRAFNMKQIDDERGVHGGAYGVRPNVHESMVFLRKMFSHQGGAGVSKLLSPPDGRLLTKDSSMINCNLITEQSTAAKKQNGLTKAASSRRGVYTLRKAPMIHEVSQELQRAKLICLHNAEICRVLDEQEKFEVWGLLAQLVDMRLNENRTSLDGLGGFGGTGFGLSLVENLLRYYESLGDVQMLSTMVCVLRDNFTQSLEKKGVKLVPSGRDQTYDLYIRRYADLLYGWGLLTIRAEIMKHLVCPPPNLDVAPWLPNHTKDDEIGTQGVGLVFVCARCGCETEPGTNCCRSCQDYAFRCAICDNAIRGLFMVCNRCGHGGHVDHLKEWFSITDVCPSGCGCKCIVTMQPEKQCSVVTFNQEVA